MSQQQQKTQPDGMRGAEKRSGFTNGLPWVVTSSDLTKQWGGGKNASRFRCCLCGHKFAEGDTARWQCMTGPYCNFMVCTSCDGPDVCERWIAMHEEAKGRFWWFTGERE
jgi:hypothetical protein